MNLNQDASKYSIYGLPSCTSISLSGNAAFTGTIYAPGADLSLNGGGNNVYDCVGAVVVNNAYFHGHFNFHYDEWLGRNGVPGHGVGTRNIRLPDHPISGIRLENNAVATMRRPGEK
jgi:hypothetical protein